MVEERIGGAAEQQKEGIAEPGADELREEAFSVQEGESDIGVGRDSKINVEEVAREDGEVRSIVEQEDERVAEREDGELVETSEEWEVVGAVAVDEAFAVTPNDIQEDQQPVTEVVEPMEVDPCENEEEERSTTETTTTLAEGSATVQMERISASTASPSIDEGTTSLEQLESSPQEEENSVTVKEEEYSDEELEYITSSFDNDHLLQQGHITVPHPSQPASQRPSPFASSPSPPSSQQQANTTPAFSPSQNFFAADDLRDRQLEAVAAHSTFKARPQRSRLTSSSSPPSSSTSVARQPFARAPSVIICSDPIPSSSSTTDVKPALAPPTSAAPSASASLTRTARKPTSPAPIELLDLVSWIRVVVHPANASRLLIHYFLARPRPAPLPGTHEPPNPIPLIVADEPSGGSFYVGYRNEEETAVVMSRNVSKRLPLLKTTTSITRVEAADPPPGFNLQWGHLSCESRNWWEQQGRLPPPRFAEVEDGEGRFVISEQYEKEVENINKMGLRVDDDGTRFASHRRDLDRGRRDDSPPPSTFASVSRQRQRSRSPPPRHSSARHLPKEVHIFHHYPPPRPPTPPLRRRHSPPPSHAPRGPRHHRASAPSPPPPPPTTLGPPVRFRTQPSFSSTTPRRSYSPSPSPFSPFSPFSLPPSPPSASNKDQQQRRNKEKRFLDDPDSEDDIIIDEHSYKSPAPATRPWGLRCGEDKEDVQAREGQETDREEEWKEGEEEEEVPRYRMIGKRTMILDD